jgi:hypothetical protein
MVGQISILPSLGVETEKAFVVIASSPERTRKLNFAIVVSIKKLNLPTIESLISLSKEVCRIYMGAKYLKC